MITQSSAPFRIDGVVEPPFFTDRSEEIARIRAALRSPPTKLLVYGPRRMGKTSTIDLASRAAERDGAHVIRADLSTASSMADVTNRLMAAAIRSVGRSWKDLTSRFVERLGISISLKPDLATGAAVPTLDAGFRGADPVRQRDTLGQTLDTLDAIASERQTTLGIVLDEFQEIGRLGGEAAEWQLRGVLERHASVSYVLAGSQTGLIERMVFDANRAFYKLLEVLHVGPIDDAHLTRWLEERMSESGRPAPGMGTRCLEVAGPRTRDIIQLALACWRGWRSDHDPVESLVRVGFEQVVADESVMARTVWSGLTPHQQDVLRAVASAEDGLTSRETMARFAFTSSGAVSNTLASLVANDLLVRQEGKIGYDFESPFFRGWVVMHALPDVGIERPSTWRAALGR